ncbi:thiamine-phosphate pyrophosphorylase [Candidatus Symbiobacter mobilis CR]|uniref:Thiamine-phosphate synthase n=2 Tax=Candidatus Symbiobacter TaxID=1436289 RepID=U5N6I5_9BURK|nr:thiamine-phosphate pyrophosphorylase [Candidatus Symbiobacter mobilis CR]
MGWVGPQRPWLYLVTDRGCMGGRPLAEVVLAAVQGGVRCVQLREKHLPLADFVAMARALKAWLAPTGVPLVINDNIDVALACEAHGVHLGQSDTPVHLARKQLPPDVFIGLSIETMADLHAVPAGCVDYLGVSPIFATPTKTDTRTVWGLDGLRTARALTTLPLVAIGGIHADNVHAVQEAGADGIAVVSAICAASDPCQAAKNLLA